MRVRIIPGESTRYHVESRHLQCSHCRARFLSKTATATVTLASGKTIVRRGKYEEGDCCPRCVKNNRHNYLEVIWHIVDLLPFWANGICSCEYFAFQIEQQLQKMSKLQIMETRLRCAHIVAAREFHIDATLIAYSRSMKGIRQQIEAGQ